LPSSVLPIYIRYDDLVPGVEDIWAGREHAQEWAVKTLLHEINLGIYAWVNTSKPGQQLSDCAMLARLFGLMGEFGMWVEIPRAHWDVEGRVAIGR